MSERNCAVDGCEMQSSVQGYCNRHYCQARRAGAVTSRPKRTPSERFWAMVEKTESCWLWTGSVSDGYGRITISRRGVLSHRFAYEEIVGPIPDGLQLDHLCRVRRCVNPEHLEPVTNQENQRRAYADVTECRRGHALDAVDCYGRRYCSTCRYLNNRRRRGAPPKRGFMFEGHAVVSHPDRTHGCRCGAYTTRTLAEARVRQRDHREDLARERGLLN